MGFYKNSADPLEQKITLSEAIIEYDKSLKARAQKALDEFFNTQEDSIYLMGPTSYLISICGTKIAVDPQIRRKEDFEDLKGLLLSYLPSLDGILISHEHDDHFSTPLAKLLKHTHLHWYLPKGMRKSCVDESELLEKNITFVKEGDTLKIGSLSIEVYNSLHVPFGRTDELVERAFFISCDKGSIFLPGDVREYEYVGYHGMKKPDLCIAHVWAGDNSIDANLYLPKMDAEAKFLSAFNADFYFLAHLYELGRDQAHMWDIGHANMLAERIKKHNNNAKVNIPIVGCGYHLFSAKEIEK